MAKIIVSQVLADAIKMLRTQKGIKSKELAKEIGRTAGYISKLEKGVIKTIDLELVDTIFSFLIGDNYKDTESWEKIYTSLQIKYTKSDIEEEIWFMNFDTVYRYLPIPEAIIDYVNEKINSLSLTREELLRLINQNAELDSEELNDKSIIENVWYQSKDGKGAAIKMNLKEEIFNGILNKKILSTSYINLFCMVYNILKFEKIKSGIILGEFEHAKLKRETTDILNAYKFYSISERENLINAAQSKEEIQSLLSTFDTNNAKLINDIINDFKLVSDMNVRITNERLADFLKNLDSDLWFILKIISLKFYLLESIEIEKKKEFIKDLEELISKYSIVQKQIKDSETY